MGRANDPDLRPGTLVVLVLATLLTAGLAGCLSPTEDPNDPEDPASGTPNPEATEPPREPPETYGPLIEGSVFRYYAEEENAWLNVTILDVNASRRGEQTIATENVWSRNGSDGSPFNIWFNRTTFAVVEVSGPNEPTFTASCDIFSVYPIESAEKPCGLKLGGSQVGQRTYTKESVLEALTWREKEIETVHTRWNWGQQADFDSWYAPEMGFFVKRGETTSWSNTWLVYSTLVGIDYPDENP